MKFANVRTRDAGLPDQDEFSDALSWLVALPPHTILLVTSGEGVFKQTMPWTVEDFADRLATGEYIEARLRERVASE